MSMCPTSREVAVYVLLVAPGMLSLDRLQDQVSPETFPSGSSRTAVITVPALSSSWPRLTEPRSSTLFRLTVTSKASESPWESSAVMVRLWLGWVSKSSAAPSATLIWPLSGATAKSLLPVSE